MKMLCFSTLQWFCQILLIFTIQTAFAQVLPKKIHKETLFCLITCKDDKIIQIPDEEGDQRIYSAKYCGMNRFYFQANNPKVPVLKASVHVVMQPEPSFVGPKTAPVEHALNTSDHSVPNSDEVKSFKFSEKLGIACIWSKVERNESWMLSKLSEQHPPQQNAEESGVCTPKQETPIAEIIKPLTYVANKLEQDLITGRAQVMKEIETAEKNNKTPNLEVGKFLTTIDSHDREIPLVFLVDVSASMKNNKMAVASFIKKTLAETPHSRRVVFIALPDEDKMLDLNVKQSLLMGHSSHESDNLNVQFSDKSEISTNYLQQFLTQQFNVRNIISTTEYAAKNFPGSEIIIISDFFTNDLIEQNYDQLYTASVEAVHTIHFTYSSGAGVNLTRKVPSRIANNNNGIYVQVDGENKSDFIVNDFAISGE